MIQIYSPENKDYEHNGDMTLMPEEAEIHVILNGEWTATIEHPIDDEGRWKYITDNAVVKMPSFNGEQLFRIQNKEKSDSGVSAELAPIFLDAKEDCFLVDVRPTEKSGQEALDIMTAPNKMYTAKSDIKKTSTAYYQTKNLIEAINGNDDNAFVKRWGGEILYNNYEVIVNEHVGADHGVRVVYGKNIVKDGFSETINMTDVVTRIVPKAYNGYMIEGDEPWVDSPEIEKYPTAHYGVITFDDVKMRADATEDDETNGVTVCDTQEELEKALKEKCMEQFDAGVDKPVITIEANMELLQNTEMYDDVKELETVSLGDTVHCSHSKLGIISDARAIELTWDAVRNKVTSVKLGDFQYNFLDNVSSVMNRVEQAIREDGTVVAEQVYGAINTLNAFLHAQSTAAKRTDSVAYLIEDLDQNSELYGAMEAGTQGLRLAKERKDGEWIWRTAVTAAGIIADLIVTGKIQDRLGKSYWDLDNGKMLLSGIFQQITDNGKKSVDIKNNRINIYSWQKEGDYVGSIGSLAIGDDLNAKQRIGVYCDTEDMLVFGYSSKKTAEGDAATVHELMKLSKDGGIECTEIPQINGTKTGRLVFSNGTYVNVKNGYIVGGKTEEGSF